MFFANPCGLRDMIQGCVHKCCKKEGGGVKVDMLAPKEVTPAHGVAMPMQEEVALLFKHTRPLHILVHVTYCFRT